MPAHRLNSGGNRKGLGTEDWGLVTAWDRQTQGGREKDWGLGTEDWGLATRAREPGTDIVLGGQYRGL